MPCPVLTVNFTVVRFSGRTLICTASIHNAATASLIIPAPIVVPRQDIDEEIKHVAEGYGSGHIRLLKSAAFVRLGYEPRPACEFGYEDWGVSEQSHELIGW
jgi:hypothetical protein